MWRPLFDSVAPHNDHLYELREGFPTALVSLGATRRMTIRVKGAPRRTTHIDLEPGSLLVASKPVDATRHDSDNPARHSVAAARTILPRQYRLSSHLVENLFSNP